MGNISKYNFEKFQKYFIPYKKNEKCFLGMKMFLGIPVTFYLSSIYVQDKVMFRGVTLYISLGGPEAPQCWTEPPPPPRWAESPNVGKIRIKSEEKSDTEQCRECV